MLENSVYLVYQTAVYAQFLAIYLVGDGKPWKVYSLLSRRGIEIYVDQSLASSNIDSWKKLAHIRVVRIFYPLSTFCCIKKSSARYLLLQSKF